MTHSRTTIQLLMQCQRLIQQEFGTRIALDHDQIVTMILAYSAQSSSTELKTCAGALSRQFLVDQNTAPHVDEVTTTTRVYRGQTIEKPASVSTESTKKTKTIIYRGQKIQVAC